MPKRILVADDESHIRKILELKLRGAGYEVKAVTNGKMAVEAVETFSPDLVVTDFKMPGEMTGIDVIGVIRQKLSAEELPIFLLTGSIAVPQKLEEAVGDLSGVTILSKPFSPRKLVRMLRETLGE